MSILTITMVFSLTACGSSTKQAEASSEETEITTDTEVSENTEAIETVTEDATTDEASDTTETQTIEGIIREATMNNLEIQAEDGTIYFFTKSDYCTDTLSNGLLIGSTVKVIYTGNLDDGTAVAVSLGDSSITLSCDREVYEFAADTIQAITYMDMDTFSTLLSYPSYMNQDAEGNGVQIDSADDLKAMADEDVFTEDFSSLADFNLFNIQSTEAGYIAYMDGSHAGFTFNETDGKYGITGFSIFK